MMSESRRVSAGVGSDHTSVHDAVRAASDRVAHLVRHLPDTGLRVPNSDWTVGDTVAHLVLGQRLYASMLRGGASPFTGRESFYTDGKARSPVSARLVPEFPERDGARLADLLVEEGDALIEAAQRYPEGRVVQWHWVEMEIGLFVCTALLHVLEHGYDIAHALGRRFPISPEHARLALEGVTAIMPAFVDKQAARGLKACLELRVRGGPRRFLLLDDGEASFHPSPPARVDCHLSADPVALYLVAMGRLGQWGPIAQGKLVAWGRKPWLAMKLTKLFPSPG